MTTAVKRREGFVYVFAMECEPPVYKIGVSHRPEQRAGAFDACPFPVRVIHSIRSSDAYAVEWAIHRSLKAQRLRREWFRLDGDTLARLLAIAECNCVNDLPADWQHHRSSPRRKHALTGSRKAFALEFGARLRKLRTQRGISREELATAAGVKPSLIRNCELAINRLRLDNAFRIADGLGVTMEELCGWEDRPRKE